MSILPGRVLLTSIATTFLFLAALAAGSHRAAAQITGLAVDNSASSGSVSNGTGENICTTTVSGTVLPLGGNIGESRNQVTIPSSSPTGFTTRFVADLCTDSGGSTVSSFNCEPGANAQALVADYTTGFGVSAPSGTSYRVTVTNQIAGAIDIVDDSGGVSSVEATMSQVAVTETGGNLFGGGNLNLTSGLPMNLAFGSVAGNYPFTNPAQTKTAVYLGTGSGAPDPHSIHSTFNAQCVSAPNGWECGIRMGLPCSITGGAALVGDTTMTAGMYPGSPARTQATDGQFVSVNLEFCGDGIVQQDGVLIEQCDNGLDPVTGNGGTASCCNSNCTVKTSGTTCRGPAGECDVADVCNGISAACPADAKKASGTPCTDDGNPCSADICSGSVNCTHPAGNAGALCRASVDPQCDLPELCTGTSTLCPTDIHQSNATPCSSDGNPCTVDHCDNSTGTCAHTAGNAGTVCRAAADTCDFGETCTGSDTNCPADKVKPNGTACPDDGKLCTQDRCNGVSKACQHTAAFAGTVCRPSAGNCDIDEVCDGTNPDCPPDVVEPAGIDCRAAAGPCDLEDRCDGTHGTCPADAKVAANTVCRPQTGGAEGLCDVAEVCDGVTNSCPPDGVAAAGTTCRTAAGACDLPEVCDGIVKTCPADQFVPSFVICRDMAGPCDVPEYCTGTYPGCPFDLKDPLFTNCRTAASVCDADAFCDGVGNDCPADTFASASVVCRDATGICDVAEHCTGSSAQCPADGFKAATSVCRPADPLDDCDVDELCSGTDSVCPPDIKKPDGTQCVGSNPNTCLNACVNGTCTDACPGFGDVNTAGCPVPGSLVVPLCCGNGLVEAGEQCDDGNQLSGGDACPSLPSDDCQLSGPSMLVRGGITNPAKDRAGCQVEYSVLNPNATLDRFNQPSQTQICEDQDPTCDLDPRPGRCRFHVAVCLNNSDPNLPLCTPAGVNSLTVINSPYLRKSSLQASLLGGNVAKLQHALQALFDPANPGAGFSLVPPVLNSQVGVCSEGMLIDVYAASAVPHQSLVNAQRLKVKSKSNKIPGALTDNSTLTLVCKAR